MEFGVGVGSRDTSAADPVERVEKQLERATCARDHGFDMVTVGNRYSLSPAEPDERGKPSSVWQFQPMLILAYLAGHLGASLKYATTMLVSPALQPLQLAEDIATLDSLCSGRLRVGISLGWQPMEFEGFNVKRSTRVRRFEELLTVVRALLSGEAVTHEGEFYNFRNVRLAARGVQRPYPPIWLGASVDAAVRRAARFGDTWSPSPHHLVSELVTQFRIYRDELERLGRPIPAERPMSRNIYLAEDRETALAEALPVYTELYRQRGAVGAPELETMRASELGEMPFIAGNPQDCVEQIAYLRDALDVNILSFSMGVGLSHEARLRTIELLGDEVIPHFQDRAGK